MSKRIEFTVTGEVPDTETELAHSAIHETSPARKELVAALEKLGLVNVRMDSKIVPARAPKGAVPKGEGVLAQGVQ